MLLIKNGYLIDPASETEGIRDILIQDGRICRIAEKLEGTGEACEVIDATGLTVLPGLVDVHVHFREPGRPDKETIRSGSLAAARGGYGTVVGAPDALELWDNIGRNYKRVCKKGKK